MLNRDLLTYSKCFKKNRPWRKQGTSKSVTSRRPIPESLPPSKDPEFEAIYDSFLAGLNHLIGGPRFLNYLVDFSSELLRSMQLDRLLLPDNYQFQGRKMDVDFYEMISSKDDTIRKMYIKAIKQSVLKFCCTMKPLFKMKLDDDFPKFLGERSNFWRYLLHLITAIMSTMHPDFSTWFILSNVCLVELIAYCHKIKHPVSYLYAGQMWICMFLHFFGERFQEQRIPSVLHLGSERLAYLDSFARLRS